MQKTKGTDRAVYVIPRSKEVNMKGIIDRFEGDYAVVEFEGRKMQDILRKEIVPEAKEGDVIVLVNGKYQIDREETQRRKAEIAKLTKDIWT
jgi:hypothetical protein